MLTCKIFVNPTSETKANRDGIVHVICSPESREPLVGLSQRKQRQCVLMGRSGYQQRSVWDLVQLESLDGANGELGIV
jgi:hypothetical protein